MRPTRLGRGLNLVGRAQAALRAARDPGVASRPATPAAEPIVESPIHPDQAADAPTRFPIGHFYSPAYDPRELAAEPRRSQIWPARPRPTPGIDWREAEQVALCDEIFACQERLDFAAEETSDPTVYFTANDQFPPLDAWILEAILRHRRPRRTIEVGSGFSSLVTARVNREQLGGEMEFTCIEPYPRPFLVAGVPGITGLRVEQVQDTPLEVFEALGDGDVLFVDTSHTVKTGGDVTWLFQEVIPRLEPGVAVHLHDICVPGDYPESWVLDGWGWNESYLLRAFLSFNSEFRVLFGTALMAQRHPDALRRAFPGPSQHLINGGSSLWIERNPR